MCRQSQEAYREAFLTFLNIHPLFSANQNLQNRNTSGEKFIKLLVIEFRLSLFICTSYDQTNTATRKKNNMQGENKKAVRLIDYLNNIQT